MNATELDLHTRLHHQQAVLLLEAHRQRQKEDVLAPVKGIAVGSLLGLSIWGVLFIVWRYIA